MMAGAAEQMPRINYAISKVDQLKKSTKRAVVFLLGEEDFNGRTVFDNLPLGIERDLRNRFDYWIDNGINDKYFHGWPNLENYKLCFSFRWRDGKIRNRLYGFLCNPKALEPSFRMCVLVYHASKTDETDFTILDKLNMLRNRPEVLAAIRTYLDAEEKL